MEIAYQTLAAHPERRIFFLSEMIHNPDVNQDLQDRGVRFLFSSSGRQLIAWDELTPDDIVVVPAFGTTLEIQASLAAEGSIPTPTTPPVRSSNGCGSAAPSSALDTTRSSCTAKPPTRKPGRPFPTACRNAPTVVVLDLTEARLLGDIIRGAFGPATRTVFLDHFGHKCSPGFDPDRHLGRIGVVNQTTMLASETRQIARVLSQALADRYGPDRLAETFADTSDTLCYATNENQNATYALIERGADLGLVVGGYNSSNTSHIVELCQAAMPTYFIQNADDIVSAHTARHFLLDTHRITHTDGWLPTKRPLDVALTCGASCPDAVVDRVLLRTLSFFDHTSPLEQVLQPYPAQDPT